MKTKPPAIVNQFSGKLAANILAKTPIIGIDYKNTDKYTISSMLLALLSDLKAGLWLYGFDRNNRPCITQYDWKSKPIAIDLYSFVPQKKQTDEGMEADKIILDYVLPRMEASKIFAFYDEDWEDWTEIQTQLAEKAQELRRTVLVLADNIDEAEITPRLKKIGFFIDNWFPNEKELTLYLGQRLKQKKWEGVDVGLELGDEEIRRIASLLTGCGFEEAENKFTVFVMMHYLKNRYGKKPCVIDWLGESERRLKEAFDFVDSRSPCVLWIDEIEKGLSVLEGDDYTKKLLGMFLTYLQESNSNVFVIATTNDVQKLPPELLRKGRFDEIFFVDLPNEAERKEVLEMYLKKYLKMGLSENFAKKAIAATKGFAASDIEGTLSQLGYRKLAYESTDISEQAILNSFKEATSVSKVNPSKIEEIRDWGIKHATPASRGYI